MDQLDPKVGEIIEHIKANLNYIVDQGKTDEENLVAAYGKVMDYFEQKGIEVSVSSIDANKQELNNLLNNMPLNGVVDETPKKQGFFSKLSQKQKIAGIIIVILIIYFMFFRKSNQGAA